MRRRDRYSFLPADDHVVTALGLLLIGVNIGLLDNVNGGGLDVGDHEGSGDEEDGLELHGGLGGVFGVGSRRRLCWKQCSGLGVEN